MSNDEWFSGMQPIEENHLPSTSTQMQHIRSIFRPDIHHRATKERHEVENNGDECEFDRELEFRLPV
jgi:hypothetical protein